MMNTKKLNEFTNQRNVLIQQINKLIINSEHIILRLYRLYGQILCLEHASLN